MLSMAPSFLSCRCVDITAIHVGNRSAWQVSNWYTARSRVPYFSGHSWVLCRFLVLVTGTLVYGKGDKLEAKREGLLEADEERIFAPVSEAAPGSGEALGAQPVPGRRRSSIGGTAPIAMRATPGSLKVCCLQSCALQ